MPMLLRRHRTLEIATFSALLVMILVLGLDICIASLACANDDAACRDAARAATLADNPASALHMAQLTAQAHRADGFMIGLPSVTVTDFVFEDYGGNPPVSAAPYVAVTTTSAVHVPAPGLFSDILTGPDGTIVVHHRCVLPIDRARVAVRSF